MVQPQPILAEKKVWGDSGGPMMIVTHYSTVVSSLETPQTFFFWPVLPRRLAILGTLERVLISSTQALSSTQVFRLTQIKVPPDEKNS